MLRVSLCCAVAAGVRKHQENACGVESIVLQCDWAWARRFIMAI